MIPSNHNVSIVLFVPICREIHTSFYLASAFLQAYGCGSKMCIGISTLALRIFVKKRGTRPVAE